MSEPHTIEIESLVLNGCNHVAPQTLAAAIAKEIEKVLRRKNLSYSIGIAGIDERVASQVGQAVVQSAKGPTSQFPESVVTHE